VGSVFATPTPEEMAYVRQTAETIPGPSTSNLVAKANELNLFVAFGMTETDEADTLYNTSVFLGPQGVFGKHRKYHLWGDDGTGGNEPLIWQRGPDEPAVVASPLGKVGLIICVEMGYYEGPVLANVQLNQGGQYRLHITNAASPNWTAVSATFNLTVLADGDADGLADVWETECGLNPASANHGRRRRRWLDQRAGIHRRHRPDQRLELPEGGLDHPGRGRQRRHAWVLGGVEQDLHGPIPRLARDRGLESASGCGGCVEQPPGGDIRSGAGDRGAAFLSPGHPTHALVPRRDIW
jgi:hypothetical protein